MEKKVWNVLLVLLVVISLTGCGKKGSSVSLEPGELPQVDVRFIIQPYPPHTAGIVAFNNGWFKDVGINISWENIDTDKVASLLIAGTFDFASAAPTLLLPAISQAGFQGFAFGDLFQAYGIVAQSDAGYKSYTEFVEAGVSPEEAVRLAMAQMKGKIFTYPSEAAIKPFIEVALEKGGITYDDFVSDVQMDANGVALMLAKRADFETGGLPARLTLEQAGMKPIITSIDLARAAQPSSTDLAIRCIQHDGWTTTTKYYNANHDTILRLASVRWRLNDYYTNRPEQAAEVHIPFLNTQAGTNFKPQDGVDMYKNLMPMYPFEAQRPWFTDTSDPLYWRYEIESVLSMYEEQGMFKPGQYKAEDIVAAHKVWQEMDDLRIKAEANFAKLQNATGKAAELRDKAQFQYSIFNYLDAERFSAQAIDAL